MIVSISKRVARLIGVLVLVSFATFSMDRLLPGDPARSFLGPNAPQSAVNLLHKQLGLNESLPVAYVKWIGRALRGNLGASYQTGQKVTAALGQRVGTSFELVIAAEIVALLVAIPLAIYAAYRADKVVDRVSSALSFASIAIPGFVLGIVLILVFPLHLHVLQVSGFTPLSKSIGGNIKSIVLPVVTLALPLGAVYFRVLRADMISVLGEDYIASARAKGLPTWQILFRHAFRPASLSLVTLAGLNIGALLSGTVIVESIFAIPGVGQLLIESILSKDIFILQGSVLLITVVFVVANVLVDLLYGVIDPADTARRSCLIP